MGLVVLDERGSHVGEREPVLCIAVLDVKDSISYYACLCLVARYLPSAVSCKCSWSHE